MVTVLGDWLVSSPANILCSLIPRVAASAFAEGVNQLSSWIVAYVFVLSEFSYNSKRVI